VARGDVLGAPLGNTTLHWRDWIRSGLIDHLIVNQNSSQCPSMWHQLWPMHRGGGYVQNYLDGRGFHRYSTICALRTHRRRREQDAVVRGATVVSAVRR
jgi:hypothetical protein